MNRPNGIGLSPDETLLYVANSDAHNMYWRVFDVKRDGENRVQLENGRTFYNLTENPANIPFDGLGIPDGLKVDNDGNLWASALGGIVIFSPDGTYLGKIQTGMRTANLAFGENGDVFLCAHSKILLLKTRN